MPAIFTFFPHPRLIIVCTVALNFLSVPRGFQRFGEDGGSWTAGTKLSAGNGVTRARPACLERSSRGNEPDNIRDNASRLTRFARYSSHVEFYAFQFAAADGNARFHSPIKISRREEPAAWGLQFAVICFSITRTCARRCFTYAGAIVFPLRQSFRWLPLFQSLSSVCSERILKRSRYFISVNVRCYR